MSIRIRGSGRAAGRRGEPWQTSHTGRERNFAAEYQAAQKSKRRSRRAKPAPEPAPEQTEA